jgi:hypothetical protein
MDEQTARDLTDKLLKHRADRGWSVLYAENAELTFPQANTDPEGWSVRGPDLWVHQYQLQGDDGDPVLAVVVTEFADGVASRERVYLTQPWT